MKKSTIALIVFVSLYSTAFAQQTAADRLRDAFVAEALGKYLQSVQYFAPTYDKSYISGGSPTTAADWQKAMADLGEVDSLCKGKYKGLTNDLPHYLRPGIVQNRYAVWCEIAARRFDLEKGARSAAAKHMISMRVEDYLKFSFENAKNPVHDETQMLMYDRERWRRETAAAYKPRFAEYGIDFPADFFDVVEKRADELKQLIERTAPTRSWEQPAFKDAAAEAYISSRYVAEYPGAKILRTGTSYKDWELKKSLSLSGSGTGYKLYTVEYNSYKRGWILAKHPNQPFCLVSEFAVGRGKKGLSAPFFGNSGFYVKCP